MPTADSTPSGATQTAERTASSSGLGAPAAVSAERAARAWAWAALVIVLAGGAALRIWGVKQGLPYAFNTDEQDHFVPHALRMFAEGTLNPHYFANPPAYTYLVHYLLLGWYGSGGGAQHAFSIHPADVFILARVAAAVLGTLALWLLYLTGARLFDRATGLLAAAIEAVAFLPVFYAHLALNDVPTLAPLTLSLLGTAGVLTKGRLRDYAIAGIGLGLACASKYTAGIVVLPLIAAVLPRVRARVGLRLNPRARGESANVLVGVALAAAGALFAFLLANPYALLDFHSFWHELVRQSTQSAEAQGKLGAPKHGGIAYYLWSLTWGLGWVPTLAALGGAVALFATARARLGWVLVPAPVAFLLFMGTEGRYFGRWLMPILPILCLLAACFVVQLARWISTATRPLEPGGRRRSIAIRAAATAVLVAGLLVQGLIHSVHVDTVLSRGDTRNLARTWMLAHIPKGTAIVAEPVSPNEWANEVRAGTSSATNPPQWVKYASLVSRISSTGALTSATHQVTIEDYVRTLAPALLGYYESHGYCWVLSGSTQSERAFADPSAVPQAVAYYRALAAQGQVTYNGSPYKSRQGGREPVPFGFDWSFDYYPLAYARPGPQITIYRLHGGRCS